MIYAGGAVKNLCLCSVMMIFDSAFVKVENLRKTIENKNFVYENNNIYVTMTFGIIERDSGKVDDVLLESADKLLYRGKINGKNVVVKA